MAKKNINPAIEGEYRPLIKSEFVTQKADQKKTSNLKILRGFKDKVIFPSNWRTLLGEMLVIEREGFLPSPNAAVVNVIEIMFEKEPPEGYVKTDLVTNHDIEVYTKEFEDEKGEKKKGLAFVSQKEIMAPANSEGLFSSIHNIEKFQFNNFNTSDVEIASYMFADFHSLKQLDLSKCDFSNVKNASGMFFTCKDLEKLDLPKNGFPNVTNASLMFMSCGSLEEIDLPKSGFPNVTDAFSMFSWCESLKKLDLPKNGFPNVTNAFLMFSWCKDLEQLDLSECGFSKVENVSAMFNSCEKLKKLNLSNFDLSNCKGHNHMDNLFQKCNSLKEIILDSVSKETIDILMEKIDTEEFSSAELDGVDIKTKDLKKLDGDPVESE